jgi:hypothetical protein
MVRRRLRVDSPLKYILCISVNYFGKGSSEKVSMTSTLATLDFTNLGLLTGCDQ